MPWPATREASLNIDTPWWCTSEHVQTLQAAPLATKSQMEAIEGRCQRSFCMMQERCDAMEAMCRDALAKAAEAQRDKAATFDEVKVGLQAVTSRVGEIAAGLEVVAGCIGHMEDRFTKAKVNTASEHAAMKLRLEELRSKIEIKLSPRGHGCGDVFKELQELEPKPFRPQNTPGELLPSGVCQQQKQNQKEQQLNPQQQQQQQKTKTYKYPQHQSLGCLHGESTTSLDCLIKRCSSLSSTLTIPAANECSSRSPTPLSLMAVPTPCLARDVHATALKSTGTLVLESLNRTPHTDVMLSHQLPATGDLSNGKHSAEKPNCLTKAADASSIYCELQQNEPDSKAAETALPKEFSPELCNKTFSPTPHRRNCRGPRSPPSGRVVAETGRMPPKTPRQQPRQLAGRQVAAPNLMVTVQENEIGQGKPYEKPETRSPQSPSFESFVCKEPPPAFEASMNPQLLEEVVSSPVPTGVGRLSSTDTTPSSATRQVSCGSVTRQSPQSSSVPNSPRLLPHTRQNTQSLPSPLLLGHSSVATNLQARFTFASPPTMQPGPCVPAWARRPTRINQ